MWCMEDLLFPFPSRLNSYLMLFIFIIISSDSKKVFTIYLLKSNFLSSIYSWTSVKSISLKLNYDVFCIWWNPNCAISSIFYWSCTDSSTLFCKFINYFYVFPAFITNSSLCANSFTFSYDGKHPFCILKNS